MSIGEAITAILILSTGVTLIAYCLKPFRKMRAIKTSDEVSISAAVSQDGMVQISGRVIAHDNTISSPIEERECVAYEYEISKSVRESAKEENDHYWTDLEEEKEAVDFMLEDHTGTAHIQTNGSEVSLTHDSRYTTSDSFSVPTTLTGDPIPFNPKDFTFEDRLRFKEGTVTPGDRISVIGRVSGKKMDDCEEVEVTSDETAYIFDEDTEEKVSKLRKRVINTFAFGFIFASFSVTYIILELI